MSVMDERRAQFVGKETGERNPRTDTFLHETPKVQAIIAGRDRSSRRHLVPVTIGAYTLYFPADESSSNSTFYKYSKRTADFAIAGGLLLVLLPLLALVAVVIFLEDGGSALYYQSRVGRNGKLFRFYKFRSMVRNADAIKAQLQAHNEADGPVFKMRNDPRITRVGRLLRKYSIDELPQLVNVLRGEMSLIGPRPHLPSEVALYSPQQRARLDVQPGLLCFREVFGRSDITFDQWIDLDLLYIRHRSLSTDMRILFRLIPAILTAEGAY